MKTTDEPEVVNVSGQRARHPCHGRAPHRATPPAEPPGHRVPVEIDATTGQAFGAASAARARQVWADRIGQLGDPGQRKYLSKPVRPRRPPGR